MDRQIESVPPGNLAGGRRKDPVYSRTVRHIHSAVGQFDVVNPPMEYPNVLALFNGDDMAGVTDLIQVFTGNAYCEVGEVAPIFRDYSDGVIKEEKLTVHLYLWFNVWQSSDPQKFFPEVHASDHTQLCKYFNINRSAITRLPT